MVTYIVDGSSVTVFLTEYRKFGPGKQILVFQAAKAGRVVFIILNSKFMIGKALGALMLSGGSSHEVWWF